MNTDVIVMTWWCDVDFDAYQDGMGCDDNCPVHGTKKGTN